MKKPVALIFGHNGGIGTATKQSFLKNGFRIIPVGKDIIDFERENSYAEIQNLLTNARPDVVVNCAGVFENGWEVSFDKTMSVNFGSNWNIIKFYAKNGKEQSVRIIMVGSSSYTGGRQLYPLYSASKAALYNLWESSRDIFNETTIKVDLINPVRTLTKMSTTGKSHDPTLEYLSPQQVADEIIKLVQDNMPSRCIDMTFKDSI